MLERRHQVEITKYSANTFENKIVYFETDEAAKWYFDKEVRLYDGFFINTRYSRIEIEWWNEYYDLVDAKYYSK